MSNAFRSNKPCWISDSLGTTYGSTAAVHSKEIGFPGGVNVWLDLEGVSQQSSAQDVIAYCNAWSDAVTSQGYVPGLYVGANSGFTGDQLASLKCTHYWNSLSNVPDVTGRGYQLIQTAGSSGEDNTTQNDQKGDAVLWLHP